MLFLSLFRKAFPRRPVASEDDHTTMETAMHGELCATSVTRRTTGLRCIEALGRGTVHQDVHPPYTSHSKGREDHQATNSSRKAREEEEVASLARRLLPGNLVVASQRSTLLTPW